MTRVGIAVVTTQEASYAFGKVASESKKYLKGKSKVSDVCIHQKPTYKYQNAIWQAHDGNPKPFIELVKDSVMSLYNLGAEVAFVPNEFADNFFKDIAQNSPVELVSMLDSVIKECRKKRVRSVCILDSLKIIELGSLVNPFKNVKSRLYENGLAKQGISIVHPSAGEQCFLLERLIKAQKKAFLTKDAKAIFHRFFEDAQKKNKFDAVLLPHLEYSDLLKKSMIQVEVFNPIQLQVKAVVERATELSRKEDPEPRYFL